MFDMDQKIDFQAQENATKMIGYVKRAAEITHTVIMADKKHQRPFLQFKHKIRAENGQFCRNI